MIQRRPELLFGVSQQVDLEVALAQLLLPPPAFELRLFGALGGEIERQSDVVANVKHVLVERLIQMRQQRIFGEVQTIQVDELFVLVVQHRRGAQSNRTANVTGQRPRCSCGPWRFQSLI